MLGCVAPKGKLVVGKIDGLMAGTRVNEYRSFLFQAAGPPVQLEPVDLSVKTPVVLQVPRYSPAAIITATARRIPSPSTTPTPPPLSASTGE